jgi:hypothetical protein
MYSQLETKNVRTIKTKNHSTQLNVSIKKTLDIMDISCHGYHAISATFGINLWGGQKCHFEIFGVGEREKERGGKGK